MSQFIKFLSFLSLIVFFNATSNLYGQAKGIEPSWVNLISYEENKETKSQTGFQYLLLDFQDNLSTQETFRQYAIKIVNSDGIQAMSDISVSFDPSYQKLKFHKINIIRNGTLITKLNESTINTFQRETQMERSLYDGSLTAVINLTDVREGDTLEYSYTIKGFNPVNKDNYATTFYQEYTVPVQRVYNRVLTNKNKPIQYKLIESATEPKVIKAKNIIDYVWDIKKPANILYDNNVPPWLDVQKRVSISTFTNWHQVSDWANSLYEFSQVPSNSLEMDLSSSSKGDKILKMIRFVQDEVRYLGFESGIGAYKPNNPFKILEQRYGDCKDKSLLLVSLLRTEGIEAYPLLVNTDLKNEIDKYLPSHNVFDHCIVYLEWEGEKICIDPTISNQGGSLKNIITPNYGKGLLIKQGNNKLTALPTTVVSEVNIDETITIDSIGGSATLRVRSEYKGAKSDYMRAYFGNSTIEEIQKEYLDYYTNLYSDIALLNDINFIDDSKDSNNYFIVNESYTISKFWLDTDDNSMIYGETYPLVLESMISYPTSAKRSMDYYTGTPFKFNQKTIVNLPEDWLITPEETKIEGNGYVYTNKVSGTGKKITIAHAYELKKDVIPRNEIAEFQEKHNEITNELSYYLTYNHSLTGFKLSWIAIVLTLLIILISIYFCIKIYLKYNPKINSNANDTTIGGWLVLPAIGLILTPIILVGQLVSDGLFNQNTWAALYTFESKNSIWFLVIVVIENLYNILFIVFTTLLIILFFKRRTSLPRLISIYYALAVVVPLIDILIVQSSFSEILSNTDVLAAYGDIFKSFIAAAIWIPYFNISERVKDTFCILQDSPKVENNQKK